MVLLNLELLLRSFAPYLLSCGSYFILENSKSEVTSSMKPFQTASMNELHWAIIGLQMESPMW